MRQVKTKEKKSLLLNGMAEYFKVVHSLQIHLEAYCNLGSKYISNLIKWFQSLCRKYMKMAMIFLKR